jgi:membrane-associated protease RseP (regulator of RpoE activity)
VGRMVSDFLVSMESVRGPGESQFDFERRPAPPPVRVHDPTGAFAVEGAAAGTYAVVVAAAGRTARIPVTLTAGERKANLELTVGASPKVIGRVVREDNGERVAKVMVKGFFDSRELAVDTDRDGCFELGELTAGGDLTVLVRSDDTNLIEENIRFTVPDDRAIFDLGNIRLLRGDDWARRHEKSSRLGFDWDDGDGRHVVATVEGGGPAARAGMLAGDVLLSIDGHPLLGLHDNAIDYLIHAPARAHVAVVFQRPGGPEQRAELIAAEPSHAAR